MPLTRKPLIILTLEGFVPSSLGCYGSSWNESPMIDRLASEGCLWDRMIAHDDDPTEVFRRWAGRDSLDRFRTAGSVELITDDARLDTDSVRDSFDLVEVFDSDLASVGDRPAASIEETQLAQLVVLAIDRLRDPEPIGVLWIHSRFLTQRWDAPRDLVGADDDRGAEDEPLAEDASDGLMVENESPHYDAPAEIPLMFDDLVPPDLTIDEETHPDVVTSWMRTYACQIRLIDELLGILMQSALDRNPNWMIAGTSGFALGQNGVIGHRVGPLRSCDVRLPMVIRSASTDAPVHSLRIPQLTDSTKLPELLGRIFEHAAPIVTDESWSAGEQEYEPAVVTRSSRCVSAVQTPRWFFVTDDVYGPGDELEVHPSGRQTRLFLKPDDLDDVNDISRLRTDVVNALLAIVTKKNPPRD